MFERFTDSARRVVVLSQEEARGLLHNYIGSEHILLGLFHARTAEADQVLVDTLPAISMDAVRDAVAKINPRGTAAVSGAMPFTPRAKWVLERSLRESTESGHQAIGAGHLLLAVLDAPQSAVPQVLTGLEIDIELLRTSVAAAMRATPSQRPAPVPVGRLDVLEEQVRRLTEQVEELRRRLDETGQRGEG